MTIKLTLDEKYHDLVKDIMRDEIIEDVDYSYLVNKHKKLIDDLVHLWFSNTMRHSDKYRVIERIHSADKIEWIETKYNWRLKSEKVFDRYVWVNCDRLCFCSADCADSDDVMTESEFKKLLEGTGLPFEAFEEVKD